MSDTLETVKNTTAELLEKLGISAETTVADDGENGINVEVVGEDLGVLIGYHGQTLRSLQLILGLMVGNSLGEWRRINLDVGKWRHEREETLVQMAQKVAEEVVATGHPRVLSGLSSQERRIIHLALQENEQVATESEGEADERKLVIKPKGSK